ncbi:MerR family transcriptional regulator [Sporosarcina sp. OR05]|uniref:helix-turn-helix domain-containing protein n=1 Tax=Sporosarcina sp. OR05 TaxID=2969819 RepID=UPI00352ACBF5
MGMKINEFSERTGLPPSTLRFYDQKKLLEPKQRLENGYRIYTNDQVSHALIIHSLRLSGISIEDIYQYMYSSEKEKERLISNWNHEVDSKISTLKIAKQYLSGVTAKEQHINLVKWDEPVLFIWFRHEVPREINPFQSVMTSELEKVKKLGLGVRPGIFIRTLESKGNSMVGEIGFILNKEYPSNLCDKAGNMYIEQLEPTLYATMECNVYDPFMCFNFMRLVHRFGFRTKGVKLEKFESPDESTFRYMIPLLNPS